MSHYEPGDMRVGLRCVAPLKKTSTSCKREYVDVEVTWVSRDGMVVEVETRGNKRPLCTTSHPAALRRPGTPTPPLGVVL